MGSVDAGNESPSDPTPVRVVLRESAARASTPRAATWHLEHEHQSDGDTSVSGGGDQRPPERDEDQPAVDRMPYAPVGAAHLQPCVVQGPRERRQRATDPDHAADQQDRANDRERDPDGGRNQETSSGHAGPATPATMIANMSTTWTTVHPSPRGPRVGIRILPIRSTPRTAPTRADPGAPPRRAARSARSVPVASSRTVRVTRTWPFEEGRRCWRRMPPWSSSGSATSWPRSSGSRPSRAEEDGRYPACCDLVARPGISLRPPTSMRRLNSGRARPSRRA